MEWLIHHHLHYFWSAAREGSMAKTCKQLHLAQPAISGQIRSLAKCLKAALVERSGRNVALGQERVDRSIYRFQGVIIADWTCHLFGPSESTHRFC